MNNEIEILSLNDKNNENRQYLVIISESNRVQEFSYVVSRYEVSIYRIEKNMNPANHDGKFIAEYRSMRNEVDFTVNNINVSGQSQGLHLGSYMLYKLVEWAKQWPEAKIKPIHLSSRDAVGDNKERRNRFYENFGIEFIYSDEEKESGISNSNLKVSDLQLTDNWQNHMEKKTIIDFISQSYEENIKLKNELKRKTNACDNAIKNLEYANNNPVKFALTKHWVLLTWFFILALVIYNAWPSIKGLINAVHS